MRNDGSKPMWPCLVLCCLIAQTQVARAQPPQTPASTFGSNTWGGRGAHRTMSAFVSPLYALTLTASDDYAAASNIFAAGDHISRARQHMHIALSPLPGLEVGLSQHVMSVGYRSLGARSLQILGDPALHLKYGHVIGRTLAIGAYAGLQVPTSVAGAGLVVEAFRLPMAAIVSYLAPKRTQLNANLGFTIDRSDRLQGIASGDRLARFAFEVNRTHQVTYALAAKTHLGAGRYLDLAPYIEWTGGIGTAATTSLRAAPSRVSLGLQGYLSQSRGLEFNLGADVRVAGSPTAAAVFAGEAPWSIFGQLALHLGECRPAAANAESASTLEGGTAGAANPCDMRVARAVYRDRNEQGGCGAPNATSVPGFGQATTTFSLVGTVTDAAHQIPAKRVQIVLSDAPDAILSNDDTTGHFASWPLTADGARLVVRVTAPGYVTQILDVPRGAPGTTVQLPIVLQPTPREELGLLQGSIRHAKTGAPIPHVAVRLLAHDGCVRTGANGRFLVQLSPGTRRVVIHAARFVAQTTLIRVEAGHTAMLTVYLQPEHGAKR